MPRLFVAIPFSKSVKDRLEQVPTPDTRDLRRVPRESLHLTLHFLGEINREQQARAADALSRVEAESFSLALAGVGSFPNHRAARVLWVGVAENPSLSALHLRIGEALQAAIGFQPESRAYAPHVTLARAKSPVSSATVEQFLKRNDPFDGTIMDVREFCLFSSELTARGPRYTVETTVSLHGPN